MKNEDNSLAEILKSLKASSPEAANEITRRYFDRVVRAASARLKSGGIRVVDGEDIAASVFESFWEMARDGKYSSSELQHGDDLWRLLRRLLRNKTVDVLRRERAEKRGGGEVRGESVFAASGSEMGGLDQHVRNEETPLASAMLSERHAILMTVLESELVREVVTLRLEGYDTNDIAEKVSMSPRSVRRKLEIARSIWEGLEQSAMW